MSIRNVRIGTKLTVSSCLAIMLIIGMLANQYISSRAVTAAFTTVQNEQIILDGIVSANVALGEMRFADSNLMKAASTADIEATLRDARSSSQRAWDGLERPISIAKVPDVLVEIREKIRLFEGELAATASRRSAQLGASIGPNIATSLAAAPASSDTVTAATQAIDESLANAHRFTDGAKAELQAAVADANTIGLSVGLLVILVLIGSAVFLTMSVSRPVRAMTAAMKRLSDGDTASDIPFTGQRDEIGEMAGALQSFRAAALERLRLEASSREAEQAQIAQRDRQSAIDSAKAEDLRLFVHHVEAGFNALSAGDLTVRMREAVAPEFEPIRAKFNDSVTQLEDMISSVVGAVGSMRVGLNQITVAANDLSQRTEQQAASLEETVAALSDVMRGVNTTVQKADDAKSAAAIAEREAEKGGTIVGKAITAMSEIEHSSSEIGKIIGVIDEIAFQTNLLALNAGVEAARAGEAGRGFAVVAQEVRGLAQRSAEAAKEIKDLISTSSAQVATGVELVTASGRSLSQIVSQVGGVSNVITEMAHSAREQAVSLAEVSTAANQMDKVTQQNAAMVEETTAAAQSLLAETEQLAGLVDGFTAGAGKAKAAPRSAPRPPSASHRPVVQMKVMGAARAAPKAAAAQEDWAEF